MNRSFGRTSRMKLAAGVALASGVALGLTGLAYGKPQAISGVRWSSGADAPLQAMDKAQLAEALAAFGEGARGGEPTRVVVTFDRPLLDSEKTSLADSGVALLSYLGDNSFFASVRPERLNLQNVLRNDAMTSVRPIERNWKLHADLARNIVRPWSVVGGQVKPDGNLEEATVAVYVMFHPDVDLDTQAVPAVQRHDGQVVSFLDTINAMVVELPAAQIKALADESAVQYIEPPLPVFSELNAENRVITQVDQVNAAPYGLNGAGVTVMVYDGGKVFNHPAFTGRLTIGPTDTSTTSDHSTHVAGTVGGDGTGNAIHRGMAPGVSIVSYGFQQPGGLMQGFLYTDPGDLQADYTAAITQFGADISNNSIGTNTEPNGYPCEWQGNYGVTDVLIDSIARGSIANTPFRLVWAAGNERQGSRCDVEGFGDYFSSAPPGNAKNHLAIGALNSNDDSMTSFSSWGPADDGRMRPDFSAPGCQAGGDGGVTSTSSAGSYNVKCGTSMASPTACGISALILQDWRTQYPSRPDMLPATLKALLAHTAQDRFNVGPDNQSGYGSIRAKDAIDHMRTGNHFEAEVTQGASYTATVIVQNGDPTLKITIAWDDVPGTPNVNPTLVNDLDLVVRGPNGVQAFPWSLDPANPSAAAVQTQRNFRDNIEQVLVNNPQPGAWSVEVRGFNVPQGPQTFSLMASPFLVNCADQGTAALNRSKYNCMSTASALVVDCGLNTSDSVIDSVTVNVSSTSNPGGLNIVLTESAPESASFAGTIALSSAAGPGELLVASGDAVTLTYEDADTGSGSPATVTSTSVVDCTGPVISGVASQNVGPRSADIVFGTNENASSTVRYGTSCGALTSTASSGVLRTAHSFSLSGLTDNTTYYFSIEATDDSGNTSVDTNGGDCYSFTTPETPDYFTELFVADNDLDNRSIFFTPNGTFEAYDACSFTISALPHDPTSGTLISQADDSPANVIDIAGGESIKLYGVSYTSLHLNPNGNITFGSGDSDTSESILDHFERPRISILFDDFNNTQGGQIRWAQLSDRVVISYLNVPQHNTTGDQNTFQYELFFDGTIAFHYLNLGAADGLAGLSRGNVTPPDFLESNLSGYAACGPRPPSATNVSFATPRGVAVDVTLSGIDDGLPLPGQLRYIITSLPPNARLYDPNAGEISNVPYELMNNGNIVRVAPSCSFEGNNSFTYVANDYGTSPDGGDSNSATVAATVGGRQAVRSYLVDNTDPGWTFDASWGFGQPTGSGGTGGGGSGSPDPVGGFTGTNVYGYNLAGNYPNNLTPARHLTSTAIDLASHTGCQLRFRRWLGIESATYDKASVEISTNGTTWNTIWAHAGGSLNPNGQWTEVSYDIAQWADNQGTVYLRWTQGTTDGSVIYCGWNIDDIEILAFSPIPPCPGDANDDCGVSFSDITYVLSNLETLGFEAITEVLANLGAQCN